MSELTPDQARRVDQLLRGHIATQDEVALQTPWFRVVAKAQSGQAGSQPYYVVEPPDYVSVLALTAKNQVLLVRQYRPAVGRTMLELPSGYVEPGEQPEQAVRRELLEETGYQANRFELLGNLAPDAGRLGNRLWVYLAQNAKPAPGDWQAEPGTELVICSTRELMEWTLAGTFDHALNLAVLWMVIARYGADLFDWDFESW